VKEIQRPAGIGLCLDQGRGPSREDQRRALDGFRERLGLPEKEEKKE
jgi:hypothetical protein